jgi:hypothetical protein
MAGYLERNGVLDATGQDEIKQEAKATIAAAVKEMEAMEQPSQEILFDYVYASGRPKVFDEGLEELRSVERPEAVKPLGPQPGASTGDVEAPRSGESGAGSAGPQTKGDA